MDIVCGPGNMQYEYAFLWHSDEGKHVFQLIFQTEFNLGANNQPVGTSVTC